MTYVLGPNQYVGDILEVIIVNGMHSQFRRGDNNVSESSGLVRLLPRLEAELLNNFEDLGYIATNGYTNNFVAIIGNLLRLDIWTGYGAHGECQ